MGGWLTMEALRASAIAGDRDLSGHLDDVILASPDIDMDGVRFADGAHPPGQGDRVRHAERPGAVAVER